MTDLELVDSFTVEVSIAIRQYGDQYDWSASNGDEADELFDSIAEAARDARSRY